jgi:hypothetical protein
MMNAREAHLMRHPLYVAARGIRAAAAVATCLFLASAAAVWIADAASEMAEVAPWIWMITFVAAIPLHVSAWSLWGAAERAVEYEMEHAERRCADLSECINPAHKV